MNYFIPMYKLCSWISLSCVSLCHIMQSSHTKSITFEVLSVHDNFVMIWEWDCIFNFVKFKHKDVINLQLYVVTHICMQLCIYIVSYIPQEQLFSLYSNSVVIQAFKIACFKLYQQSQQLYRAFSSFVNMNEHYTIAYKPQDEVEKQVTENSSQFLFFALYMHYTLSMLIG